MPTINEAASCVVDGTCSTWNPPSARLLTQGGRMSDDDSDWRDAFDMKPEPSDPNQSWGAWELYWRGDFSRSDR